MSINWRFFGFDDLSTAQLYRLLQLRQQVFVVEQNCPYLDADGKDQQAMHLLGIDAGEMIVAALRLIPESAMQLQNSNRIAIGRVVVDQAFRKNGYGRDAINTAIRYIKNNTAASGVYLSGQCYLNRFYTELGFVASGDIYLEDGIEHQYFEMLF